MQTTFGCTSGMQHSALPLLYTLIWIVHGPLGQAHNAPAPRRSTSTRQRQKPAMWLNRARIATCTSQAHSRATPSHQVAASRHTVCPTTEAAVAGRPAASCTFKKPDQTALRAASTRPLPLTHLHTSQASSSACLPAGHTTSCRASRCTPCHLFSSLKAGMQPLTRARPPSA
jgi:hypothetical protein